MHADAAQLLERDQRGARIVHQGAFGQLQFQQARFESGLVQGRQHDLRQVLVLELLGRQVDRDAQQAPRQALPGARLAAGGAQHPFADRHDQAGLLGQRDEFGRRHQSALGMAPAHQGLDPDDLGRAHVALGLVDQVQLVVLQRAAQAHLELHVAHDLHRQRRAVQLGVVLAAVLGMIHRGVGELEQ